MPKIAKSGERNSDLMDGIEGERLLAFAHIGAVIERLSVPMGSQDVRSVATMTGRIEGAINSLEQATKSLKAALRAARKLRPGA